jgi:hypothetical protein
MPQKLVGTATFASMTPEAAPQTPSSLLKLDPEPLSLAVVIAAVLLKNHVPEYAYTALAPPPAAFDVSITVKDTVSPLTTASANRLANVFSLEKVHKIRKSSLLPSDVTISCHILCANVAALVEK